MKRKFNTFSQIEINNKDTEKDFHIPVYRNRSQTSETIPPEQKEIFDIGAFGSSAYYYKNTLGRNVDVSDLYDDGQTPEDSYKLTIVNNSNGTIYVDLDKDPIKRIDKNDSETLLLKFSELQYYIYLSDTTGEDFQAIFNGIYNGESYQSISLYIDGHGEIFDPEGATTWHINQQGEGILTVNDKIKKQYIYEKGEDSVGFDLYTPIGSDYDYVDLGTNLIPGNDYEIWGLDWLEYDLYINDIFIKTGSDRIPFTLTEDMSVNNKVVITVRKHGGGANPKLRVTNSNSYVTGISTYTEDHQWIENIASFNRGESGEVDIPLNTIIGIGGMNFQARFSGTYGGIEYNNQKLTVEGSNDVYAPDGHRFWDNFQDGDEGNLIT